jgi:hypothetical protein
MQAIIPGVNFPKPGPCWFAAPDERDPGFFPAYGRISLAIQAVLRERVPASYFQTIDSLRDVKRAYPMLVYQAARPFRGRLRSELTYDVLNPQTLATLLRGAKPGLLDLLGRTEARLSAAGWNQLADQYHPRRVTHILDTVQKLSKSRKCLHLLVRSESVLLDALVELGGLGNLAAKQQFRRVAEFEKKWVFQLRRLYPGTNFLWLAPLLLEAASAALEAPQREHADCSADAIPQTPEV